MEPFTFQPKLQEIKKKTRKKNFLYSRKMKLSSFDIKNLLIFWETKTSKKFLTFYQEMKTSQTNFYISGNESPKKLLIFQEVTSRKMKKPTLKMFVILQEIELSISKPRRLLTSYISERNLQGLKIKIFLYYFSDISAKEKNFLYFSL